MATQKAVLQYEKNGPQTLKEIEKPKPHKGEVLIRVHAVAINPVDYKAAAGGYYINGHYPFIFGLDISGTIDEVGEGVTLLKKGDPVFSWLDSLTLHDIREGGFQEYSVAKVDFTAMKPSKFSFEEASGLGLPALTAAVAMFSKFDLHLPYPTELIKPTKFDNSPVFFVHGGSGAVGSAAVQFALLSGYRVITTASTKNFDFVKSLGVATEDIFDYKDPDLAEKVKKQAGKEITLAYDANSTAQSIHQALDILNRKGKLAIVLSLPANLEKGTTEIFHTFTNNAVKDESLAKWYFPYLRSVAEHGQFVVCRPEVIGKGISAEAVQKTLDYAASGKLSASRAVLQIV